MNISFMLTEPQILDRSKTETRRLGWLDLKVGQILQGVHKGQGLKPGEHPRHLAWIQVLSAHQEHLSEITFAGVAAEGFPGKSVAWFVAFFAKANRCTNDELVTVIRFRYVEGHAAKPAPEQDGHFGHTAGMNLALGNELHEVSKPPHAV